MSSIGKAIGGAFGFGAEDAAKDAAQAQVDASRRAIEEQRRQFDITQQNLRPFLEAGTTALDPLLQFALQGSGIGAPQLPGFQFDPNQAPSAPNLPQFQGEVPTLGNLQQFEFDPSKILENPAVQFRLQQGQNQLDRLAGRSRALGSGNRLAAAQEFGQGLASQELQPEFERQFRANQAENQRRLQQFGGGVQSFGLGLGANQAEQQRLANQFGLGTQRFGNLFNQGAALNQLEQQRRQQGFGNQFSLFQDQANRLAAIAGAGQTTGQNLGALGQNNANALAALQQNIGASQAAGQLGQFQGRAQLGSNLLGLGGLAGGAFFPGALSGSLFNRPSNPGAIAGGALL